MKFVLIGFLLFGVHCGMVHCGSDKCLVDNTPVLHHRGLYDITIKMAS